MLDVVLSATCTAPDVPPLSYDGNLAVIPGKPLWFARDSAGTHGLDLQLSAEIELTNGTPLNELILIQKGSSAKPIKEDRRIAYRQRIGESGWLSSQWMNPGDLRDFSKTAHDVDPFAVPPVTPPGQHPQVPRTSAP